MMSKRKIVAIALFALFNLHLLPQQAPDRFIRIEYPNGGEVLKAGGQAAIRWLSLGIDGPVAILLFKGSEQHAVIAASTANSGSYSWALPTELPDSGQYRLRICSLRDLRVNDFSDRDFAIN
jgi:hypothetical protein